MGFVQCSSDEERKEGRKEGKEGRIIWSRLSVRVLDKVDNRNTLSVYVYIGRDVCVCPPALLQAKLAAEELARRKAEEEAEMERIRLEMEAKEAAQADLLRREAEVRTTYEA